MSEDLNAFIKFKHAQKRSEKLHTFFSKLKLYEVGNNTLTQLVPKLLNLGLPVFGWIWGTKRGLYTGCRITSEGIHPLQDLSSLKAQEFRSENIDLESALGAICLAMFYTAVIFESSSLSNLFEVGQ